MIVAGPATTAVTGHVPRRRATGTRIVELDGLRGIAILMVLVWHYVAGQVQVVPGTPPAYALRLISFTWLGVDVFFVLSGFLVGGMLIEARASRNGAVGILIRRAFRIVPLYLLSLLLFLVVDGVAGANRDAGLRWLLDDPMPLWSYLLMAQNVTMAATGMHGASWLGITWSLALEVQFYLFLAGLIMAVSPDRLIVVLWLVVGLAVVLRTGLTVARPDGGFAAFLLLPTRLDSVCFGVLAAVAAPRDDIKRRISDHASGVILAIGALAVALVGLNAAGHGIGSLAMSAFGHTAAALATALAILLIVSGVVGGLVHGLLRAPVLVGLGTVSYGVYVLHQPVAGLLHHWHRGSPPQIASSADAAVSGAALIVTIGLAWLSWHAFETPMIAWGRRLARWAERRGP